MSLEFKRVSQINRDRGVKMLIYGQSGAGKTMLATTLPKPIFIDAESGTLSLAKDNLEKVFGKENSDVSYDMACITVNTLEDVAEVYQWCIDPANSSHYDSIVIDSLSEIAEVAFNDAKKKFKDGRVFWNEYKANVESIIRDFRDIKNKHVCMISKMDFVKDEVSGITRLAPKMPSASLSNALDYFFDEVYRLAIGTDTEGKTVRFLQTSVDIQHHAKSRGGLDPVEIPNLSHVIRKLNQKGKNNG